MKVALIADTSWLIHELTILRRLVVGLLDEQVRVVRIVPQWWVDTEENLAMTGDSIPYAASSWRWLRDRRLRHLANRLREGDVDLIHVLDGSLHRVGLDMGRTLQLPVIFSVWSRDYAEELVFDHHSVSIACAAATDDLVDRSRHRAGPGTTVMKVPPGVYRADESVPPPLGRPGESLSVVVIGDGRADRYYQALLEGIARARPQLGHAMYFFYSVEVDQHALWRQAERLGLLGQVTFVPGQPASRELMVQADVLIQPQPLGRVRTILLEAMAAGRPVLAADDPVLDYLRAGETAALLSNGSAEEWCDRLLQTIREPQRLIELGTRARDYVQRHHSASQFVARTLELYHRMVEPQPLPFRG